MMKNRMNKRKLTSEMVHRDKVTETLRYAAAHEAGQVYAYLSTTPRGLDENQAALAREYYGSNTVTYGRRESLLRRAAGAFINPFTAILLVLAGVSVCTDLIFAAPEDREAATVVIISAMILISGILRLVQESRSGNAAARLSEMIRTTACVERQGLGRTERPIEEIVVGDLIHLSAGDMIPADLRIVWAKDLFVSQSALTGESEPMEKTAGTCAGTGEVTGLPNLAFMGSNVISGSAAGVAAATGNDTVLGAMARALSEKPPKTSFEKGVNSVSWILIRFMLVMVPVVLFVNGFTKGDWMRSALFAISVAVGLTPEMLPMIVTTCLAKGAVSMSGQKVIIKDLNAISSMGAMDILCTDKTGTLTQDRVALEYHLDICGREDDRVLRHAFLNSFYQTGLKNLMDVAVIERVRELEAERPELAGLSGSYQKVDEIPFDFERRRMSVVVEDRRGKRQLITKGAIEEMLRVSAFVEYGGGTAPLTDAMRALVMEQVNRLNDAGMRVIGVAQKQEPSPAGTLTAADEADMVLIGYLAFLDPPKETAAAAVSALKAYGVGVKILTGDNERVTQAVCRQVGIPARHILLGADLENMTDRELSAAAARTTVFAKLSPAQKARVVRLLREGGHCVGYMGDGINDAAAMQAADVGISVDTAVDIAKESAAVILLEKELTVLEQGILEGRKTYANMIKYIKMTASSNFGNMFSVLAASAFLPFLPMESLQLILLNLIYDITCTAVPWDHVDPEFLQRPRIWDAGSVSRFMLWLGPASSLFDLATYVVMYFIICPMTAGGGYHQLDGAGRLLFASVFQAGWFVESMWSQTLVIHMIRTQKLPFIQSRASAPVCILTLAGIAGLTVIPFTPAGPALGLAPLPGVYFLYLAGIVLSYMFLITGAKKLYIRRYGSLL